MMLKNISSQISGARLNFLKIYKMCVKSDSVFLILLLKGLRYKLLNNQNFFIHQNVTIKKSKNIISKGLVKIGVDYTGFIHRNDKTLLNVNGKLFINGKYSIGRGCRFDVGENAVVKIGNGGYINANSKVIIMHSLTIGDNCAISWDCQFLDEDFHNIDYVGKKNNGNGITIGNNVWIGCGAKIYRGTTIPDGCVIASDSVVKGKFIMENAIIGGNPAKVIKENISWS